MGYDGTDWREVERDFWDSEIERRGLGYLKSNVDPDPEATRETKQYASALRKRLKDPDDRVFICKRLLRHRKLLTDKERGFVEEMSAYYLPTEWPTAAQRGWLLHLCCAVRDRLGAELAEITFAPKVKKARKRTLARSV